MNVGLIARGEDRGLGIQTWEAYRHLEPDRTLLMDLGDLVPTAYPIHAERFPDATVVPFDGRQVPEDDVREWLQGLDVVLTCETAYDWRLPGWCAQAGARLVVQVNPEFMHPANAELPVTWWNPTTWRMEHLPAGARHVPVPVALDRFPRAPAESNIGGRDSTTDVATSNFELRPLRVLHVVGKQAAADRNGTVLMAVALQATRKPMAVTVVTQEQHLPRFHHRMGHAAEVRTQLGGVHNYWELYEGHDVLVIPRRYGGLCLPAQEAMAAGLAVVMTDAEPQRSVWPVQLVTAAPGRPVRTQAGAIGLVNTNPNALANVLDHLAAHPEAVAALQGASRMWADANSWDALLPTYRDELALACG